MANAGSPAKSRKSFREITQTRKFQRTAIIIGFTVIPLFLLFLLPISRSARWSDSAFLK